MEEGDVTIADVVRLHPDRDLEDDDAPLHIEPAKPCMHKRVRLDTEAHRVYCEECDREVEAFDYLLHLARDWQRYVRHRKEAERRAAEADNRLREILRLERNARGRMRKHAPAVKLPERPWGEGSVGW